MEELSRARTEKELVAIRLELMEQGYIRKTKGKKIQPQQHSEPLRFTTTDGSVVLVGRNNRQNDSSPLKTAKNTTCGSM